jgi:hypothetical protein
VPPRIPDHQREQILTDVRAGTKSQRQIARDNGVSTTAVRKIAKSGGWTDWSREQTKNAIEANRIDHKLRLAKIAGRSAGLAERMLGSFEAMTDDELAKVSPYTRGLLLGIASDKAKDLAADDSGVEIAVSGLGRLFDGLIERHGDGSGSDG